MREIQAKPVTYAGVDMRSTLEGRWAKTLDKWGVGWAYEAVQAHTALGMWIPDFWVPEWDAVLEVKGGHNHRLEKVWSAAQENPELRIVLGRASGPDEIVCFDSVRGEMWFVYQTGDGRVRLGDTNVSFQLDMVHPPDLKLERL